MWITLNPRPHTLDPKAGQAALTLVLLIGGITVTVGVTLAFVFTSFLNASFGFEMAERALATASAGTDDAMVRLIRNKDWESTSPYAVPLGTYSASVTVTHNSPAAGKVTIVSLSSVSGYSRKLQTIVSVSSSTGEMKVLSSSLVL